MTIKPHAVSRGLVAGLIAFGAMAVSPARADEQNQWLVCAVLEGVPDGAVYVSDVIKLPPVSEGPVVEVVYADAFEAHVRRKYVSSDKALHNEGCQSHDTQSAAEESRKKIYRLRGNRDGGERIQTSVSWTPDDSVHEASRSTYGRVMGEVTIQRTAGLEGYLYCVQAVGPTQGPIKVTFSEIMPRPSKHGAVEFKDFAGARLQLAIRGHAARLDGGSYDLATCVEGPTLDLVWRSMRRYLAAYALPAGGETYGEPKKRDVIRHEVVRSSWVVDAAGYREYGAGVPDPAFQMTAAILEGKRSEDAKVLDQRARFDKAVEEGITRRKNVLLNAASVRRRRDCEAGVKTSCQTLRAAVPSNPPAIPVAAEH